MDTWIKYTRVRSLEQGSIPLEKCLKYSWVGFGYNIITLKFDLCISFHCSENKVYNIIIYTYLLFTYSGMER